MYGEIRMQYFVSESEDGMLHVQNILMGMNGQHHVHTKDEYEKWKKNGKIESRDITMANKRYKCNCGLKPGEVKDHEGRVYKLVIS